MRGILLHRSHVVGAAHQRHAAAVGLACAAFASAACGQNGTPRHTVAAPQPTDLSQPTAATNAPAPSAAQPNWQAAGVDWRTPPRTTANEPFTPPVPQTFTLANGVRVVLIENHRLPLVTMQSVHLAAGAREDGAHAGLASLTVDMLDEGAGTFTAETLPEQLERLGASLSVDVAADYATVEISALAFETAVPVFADVILRPAFAAREFDRVKADTLQALTTRRDNPRQIAAMVFARAVFGEHPYGASADGTVGTVKGLTLAQAKAFWAKAYTPATTTLLIAGRVTRADCERLLTAHFGAWRAPANVPPPRKAPVAGPVSPLIALVHRPDAPQSVVIMGRRSMAAGDERAELGDVINTAIGGSFASRLNARLREALGYTYGISSRFWRGRLGGTWAVSTSLRTDVTIAGIEEALRIIEQVQATPLDASEWQKAQDLLIRGMPQTFETNAGIANAFRGLVVENQTLDYYVNWHQRIAKASAADAQAIAAQAWRDLTIVIVGDERVLQKDLTRLTQRGLRIVPFDADGNPLAPLALVPPAVRPTVAPRGASSIAPPTAPLPAAVRAP